MTERFDPPALPPSVRRVIPQFRFLGWASFWIQLVLAVIAGLIFIFAGFSASVRAPGAAAAGSSGSGPGILFAVLGLIALGVSIYWSFRYTRLALQLQSANPNLRPKRTTAANLLRQGLMLNLAGMGFSLIGAESIAGILFGKILSQPQGGFVVSDPSAYTRIIQPVDIFVVLGNTHITFAHFIGIVTSLWLINSVNKDEG